MSVCKVGFLGHSYVRDLCSISDHNLNNSTHFPIDFGFFYKPGGTVRDISIDDNCVNSCLKWKPDVLFTILGGNDIRYGWDIKVTFEKYKAFCSVLKEVLPNLILICSTIEPRFAPSNHRYQTPSPSEYKVAAKAFNRLLQKWRLPNYRFYTWGTERLENNQLFARDLVHLNEKGLTLMWKLAFDLASKVVNEVHRQ